MVRVFGLYQYSSEIALFQVDGGLARAGEEIWSFCRPTKRSGGAHSVWCVRVPLLR